MFFSQVWSVSALTESTKLNATWQGGLYVFEGSQLKNSKLARGTDLCNSSSSFRLDEFKPDMLPEGPVRLPPPRRRPTPDRPDGPPRRDGRRDAKAAKEPGSKLHQSRRPSKGPAAASSTISRAELDSNWQSFLAEMRASCQRNPSACRLREES